MRLQSMSKQQVKLTEACSFRINKSNCHVLKPPKIVSSRYYRHTLIDCRYSIKKKKNAKNICNKTNEHENFRKNKTNFHRFLIGITLELQTLNQNLSVSTEYLLSNVRSLIVSTKKNFCKEFLLELLSM